MLPVAESAAMSAAAATILQPTADGRATRFLVVRGLQASRHGLQAGLASKPPLGTGLYLVDDSRGLRYFPFFRPPLTRLHAPVVQPRTPRRARGSREAVARVAPSLALNERF